MPFATMNARRAAQKFLGGNRRIRPVRRIPLDDEKTGAASQAGPNHTAAHTVDEQPVRPLVQNDISSHNLRKIEPPDKNLIARAYPRVHAPGDHAYGRGSADANFVRHRHGCRRRRRNMPRLVPDRIR